MTVDYASLMASEPATYGHASEAWAVIREKFDRCADDYTDNVVRKVGLIGWGGFASLSARISMLNGLSWLTATSEYLEGVSILLADAAIGIAEAQAMVEDAKGQARSASLWVDESGVVQRPAPLLPTPALDAAMAGVAGTIGQALALAQEVDDAVYSGLGNAYYLTDGTWLTNARQVLEDIKGIRPALVYEYGDDGLDPPLRPWNVASPGWRDRGLALTMVGAAVGLDETGRHTAASMLKHWLDGSGTPVEVSPAEMMNDIPAFRAEVDRVVQANQGSGAFATEWANGDWLNDAGNREGEGLDWYYSLNDFRWRVVGTSHVVDGVPTAQYTVEVYKNWQFNPDRTPITIPGVEIDIEQERLMHLHETGLARDFVVIGSAHVANPG